MKKFTREALRIWNAWNAASPSTYGAAVAYYTVFSLAPLLVIAVSIAGLFFDQGHVQAQVLAEFTATFGADGALLIHSLIQSDQPQAQNIVATVVGVLLVIVGAMGIFSALRNALNVIFESLPNQKLKGFWSILWQNLVSIGMVFSVGFLLLVSLMVSAILTAFGTEINTLVPSGAVLISILDLVLTYVVISLFLGALIAFLPTKRLALRPAIMGGFVAGAFFMIGKYALGIYFGLAKSGSAYGAASSIILLILWAYYLSQALFLSAIVTQLYFIPRKNTTARKGTPR